MCILRSLGHEKNGVAREFESEDHPHEGILKRTGSIHDQQVKRNYKERNHILKSAQYTIVLLPGHPHWNKEAASKQPRVPRRRLQEGVDFQFREPKGRRIHLVHSVSCLTRNDASTSTAGNGALLDLVHDEELNLLLGMREDFDDEVDESNTAPICPCSSTDTPSASPLRSPPSATADTNADSEP